MRVRECSVRRPSISARCVAFAAVLGVLGTSPAAFAVPDAPSIELAWSGPGTEAACIGGERLTHAVNEYLGREAISSPPAELMVSVAVERQKNGWRALIKLTDQRAQRQLGERELFANGPLCTGLDEPLQLAVALLVDSELAAGAPANPSDARANPPSQPVPPEADEPPEEPEQPPEEPPELFAKRPWQFALDLSLLAESGVLPSLAAGMEFGFDASPAEWLSLRAHGAAFVPQTLEPGPLARVKATVFYGGVAICPRTALTPRLTFMGCFGAEAGRLSVSRTGLQGGSDSAHRLLMGSLGTRLTLALSPKWSGALQLTALLPLKQDRFLVEVDGNMRELFEVSTVSWVAGIGGSFMF